MYTAWGHKLGNLCSGWKPQWFLKRPSTWPPGLYCSFHMSSPGICVVFCGYYTRTGDLGSVKDTHSEIRNSIKNPIKIEGCTWETQLLTHISIDITLNMQFKKMLTIHSLLTGELPCLHINLKCPPKEQSLIFHKLYSNYWNSHRAIKHAILKWYQYHGEGNGNPLQYSWLENPWTEEPGRLQSVGLQKSWTRLSNEATTTVSWHWCWIIPFLNFFLSPLIYNE